MYQFYLNKVVYKKQTASHVLKKKSWMNSIAGKEMHTYTHTVSQGEIMPEDKPIFQIQVSN